MTESRKPRAFDLDKTVEVPASEPKAEVEASTDVPTKKPKAKKTQTRKPRAIANKAVLKTLPEEAAQRHNSEFTTTQGMTADELAESLTPPPPSPTRPRFRWSRLFFGALAGLVSLGIGLWVDELIRGLFARQDWLGWVAVGLTALLIVAALAMVVRELWGLARMAQIEHLRQAGAKATANNDLKLARQVTEKLAKLYSSRPDTARGRAELVEHSSEVLDGKDLIHLAERDLMRPLDQQARGLVMGSAKRVSVVTAVSPRAIVDIGFVLVENIRLIRRVADLYGGRPGTFGFWRLARNVIGHLAVTGTIAVGDGLIQQVVGHGLAAKLSSRLGEGVVNGMLTARIGIAAIDVCRPLPFSDQHRPGVKEFMAELTRSTFGKSDEK